MIITVFSVIKIKSLSYTVPGMTKWLHRNGFSYRKPMGVPHKFSAETQRAFVETYNELKQKSGDDEPILNPDAQTGV